MIDLSKLTKRKTPPKEKKLDFQIFINFDVPNTPETRDRYTKSNNSQLLDWLADICEQEEQKGIK